MEVLERIKSINPRIIYVLILVVIAIPLIKPFGLPMMVMQPSKDFYNVVESLKPGARVMISWDYGAGSDVELDPIAKSLLIHLVKKGAKIYATSSIPDGPMFAERSLKVLESLNQQYGSDYVNLGFFAGGESGIAAWAENFESVFRTDWRKTPAAQIPMMEGIKSAKDFDLIVTLNTGPGGYGTPDVWVRQIYVAKNVPLAMGVTAIMGPQTMPYLQSHQIAGLLVGLRSAAEYEALLRAPGIATAQMDAQSAAHTVILILIILGNLGHLADKKHRRKTAK
ncbi:MAG TPA: hypothetical protein GXX30_02455 [Firmicutes bacterium]|nr:hypothetical protein [Candidatus Fermentithermobacillaceae bacterium]